MLADSLRSPLLYVLLLLNAVLIVIHILVAASPNEDVESWTGYLRIDRDRSLSEWFESAQMIAAILLLSRHAQFLGRPTYQMVAALLVIMLLDNLLELREYVALSFAPDQQATAEFVMVAVLMPFLGAAAFLAFRRADHSERSDFAAMLIVLTMFALFGVAIDYLHEKIAQPGSIIYAALSVVEDGGELVSLSLLLTAIVQITRNARSVEV